MSPRRWMLVAASLVFSLAAGCAAAGAGTGAVAALALSLALFGWGCADSRATQSRDAATDAATDGSMHEDGGTWERCCNSGFVDTCYCPPMTACNYGWFTDCGNGTCGYGPDACGWDGGVDASAPIDASTSRDAGADGGTWQPCCQDGVIESCYCPAGAVCNYWFTACGDDTCVSSLDTCPDAGGPTP